MRLVLRSVLGLDKELISYTVAEVTWSFKNILFHQCLIKRFRRFVWCLDRHSNRRPEYIHSTEPPCQTLVRINYSPTGNSIVFDCTIISNSLSAHFLFGK